MWKERESEGGTAGLGNPARHTRSSDRRAGRQSRSPQPRQSQGNNFAAKTGAFVWLPFGFMTIGFGPHVLVFGGGYPSPPDPHGEPIDERLLDEIEEMAASGDLCPGCPLRRLCR